MQEAFQKPAWGLKLGFMSFFCEALCGIEAVPQVIPGWRRGADREHFMILAWLSGTRTGLVVPVVRDAGPESFAQIEQSILITREGAGGEDKIETFWWVFIPFRTGGVYGSLLSTPDFESAAERDPGAAQIQSGQWQWTARW